MENNELDDELEDDEEDENYELIEALENLQNAFSEFDHHLKHTNRHVWEQWKAGGKMVSDEFHSMYPSAQEAVDQVT